MTYSTSLPPAIYVESPQALEGITLCPIHEAELRIVWWPLGSTALNLVKVCDTCRQYWVCSIYGFKVEAPKGNP